MEPNVIAKAFFVAVLVLVFVAFARETAREARDLSSAASQLLDRLRNWREEPHALVLSLLVLFLIFVCVLMVRT